MSELQADEPPTRSALLRGRLFPHEWLTIAALGVAVYLLERLPVTYPRSALFLSFATPILLTDAVAVALIFAHRWWLGRHDAPSPGPLADELLLLVRCSIPILLTVPVAFLLKCFIYLINPRVYDPLLSTVDRTIHLGFDPTLFLTTLFGEPHFLAALDVFYSGLYYFFFVTFTSILLSIPSPAQRLRFSSAFVMLWTAATAGYLLLPSWGPAFTSSAALEPVLRHMPLTVQIQNGLYQELSSLVHHPMARRVIRFGSVAAFPSLHVGIATLFTLASRNVSRRWFRFNLLFVALMLIGSVITGYHYMVDGYAGALLAGAGWWISGRFVQRAERLREIS